MIILPMEDYDTDDTTHLVLCLTHNSQKHIVVAGFTNEHEATLKSTSLGKIKASTAGNTLY